MRINKEKELILKMTHYKMSTGLSFDGPLRTELLTALSDLKDKPEGYAHCMFVLAMVEDRAGKRDSSEDWLDKIARGFPEWEYQPELPDPLNDVVAGLEMRFRGRYTKYSPEGLIKILDAKKKRLSSVGRPSKDW